MDSSDSGSIDDSASTVNLNSGSSNGGSLPTNNLPGESLPTLGPQHDDKAQPAGSSDSAGESKPGESKPGESEPTIGEFKTASDFKLNGESKPPESKSKSSGSSHQLKRLDGYILEGELGRGGMGEVYLATEEALGRQVALKVLPAANRISPTQVKRFQLEALAAAQLTHDHIVPVHHIGECEGVHYFTMRYIEGYDLLQVIRSAQQAIRENAHANVDSNVRSDTKGRSKSSKAMESTAKDRADSTHGRIDLSANSFVGSQQSNRSGSAHKLAVSVALIGQAVAEALHHAHQHGIVHRDIKPSNLMLDYTNKIWVTDFGLAQLQDAPRMTQTGDLLGTLRYMSPEQVTGRRAFVDHRTDIYSLGVTLYELVTLKKACPGQGAQEILR